MTTNVFYQSESVCDDVRNSFATSVFVKGDLTQLVGTWLHSYIKARLPSAFLILQQQHYSLWRNLTIAVSNLVLAEFQFNVIICYHFITILACLHTPSAVCVQQQMIFNSKSVTVQLSSTIKSPLSEL